MGRRLLMDAGHDPDWQPQSPTHMTESDHRQCRSRMGALCSGIVTNEEFEQNMRLAAANAAAACQGGGLPPIEWRQRMPPLRIESTKPMSDERRKIYEAVGIFCD